MPLSSSLLLVFLGGGRGMELVTPCFSRVGFFFMTNDPHFKLFLPMQVAMSTTLTPHVHVQPRGINTRVYKP